MGIAAIKFMAIFYIGFPWCYCIQAENILMNFLFKMPSRVYRLIPFVRPHQYIFGQAPGH